MHRLFKKLLDKEGPASNPIIGNGISVVYIKEAMRYIDSVFRSARTSLPEGLEYIGCERCTPQEEYDEITRAKNNNKRIFDLAKSYLFVVKYFFRFEGIDLPPRYLYLPYVLDGGIIYLGGSCYRVSPVISETISPTSKTVFIRLLRDKMIFERIFHNFIIDNKRETNHVVWSKIHKKKVTTQRVSSTTRAKTCNVHYLLGKYGFSEMFRRFVNFIPIVGEEEINIETYPPSKWIICRSTEVKPIGYLSQFYTPCKIRLAIPKELWSADVKNLVAGFYYVADNFPNRIRIEYLENTSLWMILLGHIIFSGVYGEGKLYEQIAEHYRSIDECIDTIVVTKFKEAGFKIENFYDLLFLILQQFDDWTVNSTESNKLMYNKTLEVLYYVLFNVTSTIFNAIFILNKQSLKKKLVAKEIIRALNKHLTIGVIHGIREANLAVSNVSYSGDNKYIKIASAAVPQHNLTTATRGKKTRITIDSTKRINMSLVIGGSVLYLSKSNPSPAVHLNLFAEVDLKTARIIEPEKFKQICLDTDNRLKGLTSN